jgi:hypothetical protein
VEQRDLASNQTSDSILSKVHFSPHSLLSPILPEISCPFLKIFPLILSAPFHRLEDSERARDSAQRGMLNPPVPLEIRPNLDCLVSP